jgi:hypothetical protein
MDKKIDNLIEVGIEEGNEIFFKILKEYPELDENDERKESLILSLMTNCIVQLHMRGWSEKNLVNEVFDWCEIARDLMDEEDGE